MDPNPQEAVLGMALVQVERYMAYEGGFLFPCDKVIDANCKLMHMMSSHANHANLFASMPTMYVR